MYKKYDENKPVNLLADPMGSDVIAIPCEPGNGKIEIGTVMYRKASGMYAPASAAEAVDSNYLVVLDEAVDTDADASVADDARAYRAGKLIAGLVKLKDGSAIDAAAALALRKQGIVFEQMAGGEAFDNTVGE